MNMREEWKQCAKSSVPQEILKSTRDSSFLTSQLSHLVVEYEHHIVKVTVIRVTSIVNEYSEISIVISAKDGVESVAQSLSFAVNYQNLQETSSI